MKQKNKLIQKSSKDQNVQMLKLQSKQMSLPIGMDKAYTIDHSIKQVNIASKMDRATRRGTVVQDNMIQQVTHQVKQRKGDSDEDVVHLDKVEMDNWENYFNIHDSIDIPKIDQINSNIRKNNEDRNIINID